MQYSQRYFHFFDSFSLFVLPIYLDTKQNVKHLLSKNDQEIKLVVLNTINPINQKKNDKFFRNFSFFTQMKKISFGGDMASFTEC